MLMQKRSKKHNSANSGKIDSQIDGLISAFLSVIVPSNYISCIRRTFFHGGEYQKSGVRLIYEYSKT